MTDIEQQRKKKELKEFALSIVRAQTNVYVKELLREHSVKIGATKKDFDNNLTDAIENGVLEREHLETWLHQVEGWGEQHVYVYRLTKGMMRDFRTEERAHQKVKDARLAKYWRKSTTALPEPVKFPTDEDLKLVSITYSGSLLFHWHKGTQYWVRTKEEEQHDKPREWIDGFEYEFRAFRGRAMREVMRFEIRPAEGLAALFIPKPIHSAAHSLAYETAKSTIAKVLGSSKFENRRLLVGNIIKNLDREVTFNSAAAKSIAPHSTRLRSGLAEVQFAATSREGSYLDSQDISKLRRTIRTDDDFKNFAGTTGTFRFRGRKLGRVELFARDHRIRLWSSLTKKDVWYILRTLAGHQ